MLEKAFKAEGRAPAKVCAGQKVRCADGRMAVGISGWSETEEDSNMRPSQSLTKEDLCDHALESDF